MTAGAKGQAGDLREMTGLIAGHRHLMQLRCHAARSLITAGSARAAVHRGLHPPGMYASAERMSV
jgi:hypothetical protein